jgi:hypothetical protein
MTDFIIKKLPYDLSSNAGLALVGKYPKRIGLDSLVDGRFPLRAKGVANSNIIGSYLGFAGARQERFRRHQSVSRRRLPQTRHGCWCGPLQPHPAPPHRPPHQRAWNTLADELNLVLLSAPYNGGPMGFGALPCGYVALG